MPPSDSKSWYQSQNQIKMKQKTKEAKKAAMTNVGEQAQNDSKTSPKIKNTKGSDRETDQAEQFDALLNQSTRVFNKNKEAGETIASNTFKRENRSASYWILETLRCQLNNS